MSLKDKKIILGVTGGIAAYKSCSLVNYLIKEGADVRVIMTKSATQFVGPLTFQALTNHAVYTGMFKVINQEEVEHIALATWADMIVVAPATASILGKVFHGIADDLLTTVIMALPQNKKVVFAPAMNTEMWNNPIVQKNVDNLRQYNERYLFVDPEKGMLACRTEGVGKMSDVKNIVDVVKNNI